MLKVGVNDFNFSKLRSPRMHPLILGRLISSTEREKFLMDTPPSILSEPNTHVGIRGTCFSSIEHLVTHGLFSSHYQANERPTHLYFFPNLHQLNEKVRIGIHTLGSADDILQSTKTYATTSELEDRFVRWGLKKLGHSSTEVKALLHKLFGMAEEYSDLDEYFSLNRTSRTTKQALFSIIKVLSGKQNVYEGFDAIMPLVHPRISITLGFLVFFRPSIITEFTVYDASPDDGFCIHAPRGIGIEHVAGVLRADGTPFRGINVESSYESFSSPLHHASHGGSKPKQGND